MLKPRVFLGSFAALLIWFTTTHLLAQDIKLPELGSANRAALDQQQENALSLAFLEAIYQQADIVTEPELNQFVRNIAHRLLRHSKGNSRQFQFYIINDNNINAFAGPGGIIAINTGLILAAKSEDEIAAVLAHEIQHVQQEHISRMFASQKKNMLTTLGTIVGAILVGSQNPEAGAGLLMGSMAYSIQEQLAFSRDNEWEADRTGIELLAAAGYNPNAMADFFETLSKRYQNDRDAPEMLLTHPVSSKRLADSRARATSYKQTPPLITNNNLALAKLHVAILQGKTQELTTLTPSEKCYLSLAQNRHLFNPQQTTNCDLQDLSEHTWSRIAQLNYLPFTQSMSEWQNLLELLPNDISVQTRYADYLLEQRQPTQLIDQLSKNADQFSEQYELWKRLAQAWNQLNNEAQEAYYMAKAYASIGAFELSETQLNRAEKQSKNITEKNLLLELKQWLEVQKKERDKLFKS